MEEKINFRIKKEGLHLKKITAFINLLSLMFSLGAMAQVEVTIPTVQAPVTGTGGTVTMPINVSNFTKISAITLKITYDSGVMTYVSDANAPPGVTFIVGSGTPGIINLGWFDATDNTPINIASGKLVDLNFTYIGGTGTVGFIPSACDLGYSGGVSISGVVYQNGSLILPARPVAPVLQTPATGIINQPVALTLTWGNVVGATTYRVQVATDSLFVTLVVNDSTLTTASKHVSALLNNTKYYWRADAKNIGGTSSYSAIFNFTTGTSDVETSVELPKGIYIVTEFSKSF